jgi:hypothetical protein
VRDMKFNTSRGFVKCDVCGSEREREEDDRGSSFRGHKMMVLSIHDLEFTAKKHPHDHRRFYDICSMACLSRFASENQMGLSCGGSKP